MNARVHVRRRGLRAWCVYIGPQFISVHATREAARIAAQQIARVEAEERTP